MAKYNEYTEKLLLDDRLYASEACFLTERSSGWVYTNKEHFDGNKLYADGQFTVDTELFLEFSSKRPSRTNLDAKSKQLLERRLELKAEDLTKKKEAEAVNQEVIVKIPDSVTFDPKVPATITNELVTEEQTTEEEVTDAHSIPEVNLESDPDPVNSFNSVFDTIAITVMAIFFTTAIVMVASKEDLFGNVGHYVSDIVKAIGSIFG